MLFEVDNRCEGHYGHHDARRYNFQYNTVYRTILIRVVSPWLFSSPDRYLRILANVKPIDFFAKNFWPDFVATLERPWSDCTLYVCRLSCSTALFIDILFAGDCPLGCQLVIFGCSKYQPRWRPYFCRSNCLFMLYHLQHRVYSYRAAFGE